MPGSLDDGVATVDNSTAASSYRDCQVQASGERARGTDLQAGIIKQCRAGARTAQRRFRLPEASLVGPDDPYSHGRPDCRGAIGAEPPSTLELVDGTLALAAGADDPGELDGARCGQRGFAAGFKHPQRTGQEADGRRVPAPRREPGAPVWRIAEDPARTVRGPGRRRRAERIGRRRLVDDGDARRRLTKVGGAQPFQEQTRTAGRSPRRVEQLRVRWPAVVVDEHH